MLCYRQDSRFSDAFPRGHSAYIVVTASEELSVAYDHVHHEVPSQTLQLQEVLRPTVAPGQLQLGRQLSSLLRGRVTRRARLLVKSW